MELSPEEYGNYWSGALRLAAGAFLVLLVHRGVGDFLAHPDWPPRVLGWSLLGLAMLVGAFVAALGLARVVRAAVRAERRT
ncbi:MAG: hypothetical protein ACOC0X_02315 [Halobacteriota archaeon]